MNTSKETIEIIKRLRKNLGLSVEELAKRVGIAKSTLSRYESLQREFPVNDIGVYANALNTTVEHLLGIESVGNVVNLPIVGYISCGNGEIALEDIQGYEQTPKEWLNGGEYFYLRAKGDSMTGERIQEGDLLLIRKQDFVENGEVAAIVVDDEAVLKKVTKQDDLLILESANPKYPPKLVKEGDVRVVGKLKKIVINF